MSSLQDAAERRVCSDRNLRRHCDSALGEDVTMKATPPIDRTLSRVAVDENGCWNFMGARGRWGYGRVGISVDGKTKHQYAHRVTYEHFVGPIPDGLMIDHLCRNPPCCNPEHLEPVTPQVNQRRGVGPTGINSRKTHCLRGHELAGDNLAIRKSNCARTCRICVRLRQAAYDARRRGAA